MIDFQEKYNVFQSALEIPEPWYIFHHELAKEEKTLQIYIEYRSDAEFPCANCGSSCSARVCHLSGYVESMSR